MSLCRISIVTATVTLSVMAARADELRALPREIPAATIDRGAVLNDILASLGRIANHASRFEAISRTLRNLESLSSEERRPIVVLLDETVDDLSYRQLVRFRLDAMMKFAPATALKVADRIPDALKRETDAYLAKTVIASSATHPALAKEILARIEDRHWQVAAVLGYVADSDASFDQVAAMFSDLDARLAKANDYQLQRLIDHNGRSRFLRTCMRRFAAKRPLEVCAFLSTYLDVNDVIEPLCACAWQALRDGNRRSAKIIYDFAIERLPNLEDPSGETGHLFGLRAELYDEEPLEAFDKIVMPAVCVAGARVEPLTNLLSVDKEALLERVQRVAKARREPVEKLLPEVVAAGWRRPNLVIDWLAAAPDSEAKNACIVPVASGLSTFINFATTEDHKRAIQVLWGIARGIPDKDVRLAACNKILSHCQRAGIQAPMALVAEARSLYYGLDAEGRRKAFWLSPWLQTLADQEDWILESIATRELPGGVDNICAIISISSLSDERKLALFRRLEELTKDNRWSQGRIACGVALLDCDAGLQAALKALPPDRETGDWPRNVQDAVRWIRRQNALWSPRPLPDKTLSTALWKVLRTAAATDRDLLLTELSASLGRLADWERAHGVALLIESARQRAVALSNIAGQQE